MAQSSQIICQVPVLQRCIRLCCAQNQRRSEICCTRGFVRVAPYTPNSPLVVMFCNEVSGLTSKRTEFETLKDVPRKLEAAVFTQISSSSTVWHPCRNSHRRGSCSVARLLQGKDCAYSPVLLRGFAKTCAAPLLSICVWVLIGPVWIMLLFSSQLVPQPAPLITLNGSPLVQRATPESCQLPIDAIHATGSPRPAQAFLFQSATPPPNSL